MRAKDAKKLHNRDEVEVQVEPGVWEPGYVLGEPREEVGRVIIPVPTRSHGWLEAIGRSLVRLPARRHVPQLDDAGIA